jgi:hypothetical protein
MGLPDPQLQKQIEEHLPDAVRWAEQVEKEALEKGKPLSPLLRDIAQELGIQNVDTIRVLEVDTMPTPPENLEIENLTDQFSRPIAGASGLSFGRAILVLRPLANDYNLLTHELVHVRQYEQAGSLSSYLRRCSDEAMHFEYPTMPLELEATREADKRFPPHR